MLWSVIIHPFYSVSTAKAPGEQITGYEAPVGESERKYRIKFTIFSRMCLVLLPSKGMIFF
jgi:hypothetical protein